MGTFTDQLRQVLRRLGRAPMFTIITLITLAAGIGANTVIFSVLEGVLLKPLPYPEPDRLIGVWHTAPGVGINDLNMAPSLPIPLPFVEKASSIQNLKKIAVIIGPRTNRPRVTRIFTDPARRRIEFLEIAWG